MATRKTTTTTSEKPVIKKTSRVATVRKTTPTAVTESSSNKKETSPKIKKSYVIGVLALILLIAVLYTARSVFVAAMVNGEPVTRLSLVKELEKQNGKQALNSLVTKTLILQEARKQNVEITNQEIDAEIKKIEQNLSTQGQKLDQVLVLQGMTRESLVEQIKIQKLIEKMVGKDIKVTDAEVNKYIADNKESFPPESNSDQIKIQVRSQLQQEKLNTEVQAWLDKLKKVANINYFVNF